MYAVKGIANACVREKVGEFEISIAFDDSYRGGDLIRSDIRVYSNDNDVTQMVAETVFGNTDVIVGTIENLLLIYEFLKKSNEEGA